MQALTTTQSLLEQNYAASFTYSGASFSTTSPQGYYTISVASGTTSYTVTATATGLQLQDTQCATFSIDQTGTKSAANSSGATTTTNCWPQ